MTTRHVSSTPTAGGVKLHEYRHVLTTSKGRLPVRTFLTEGLASRGGPEVRVTVPEGWTEGASAALRTLEIQERFVAEGRPATLGGFTGFRIPGLAGGNLIGVTYARGQRVEGIPGSEDALVAVLLHPEELALVQRGLAARVLGALAAHTRYFPYPPWWELRAQPVRTEAQQASSLLEQISPRVSTGDLRVTQLADGSLHLSIPPQATAALAQLWSHSPQTRTLALLAQLAPDADGQVIWSPGASEPQATTSGSGPPRRMGYAFFALVSHDELALRMIEDGFVVLLPPPVFDKVRDALVSGRSETLRERDLTLVLEVRPPGWEVYHPESPRPVELVSMRIVLLLPNAEMQRRASMPALTPFLRAVQDTVERLARQHPVDEPTELTLELTLSPGAPPQLTLASQPSAALEGPLRQALQSLPPAVVREELPLRLELSVQPP